MFVDGGIALVGARGQAGPPATHEVAVLEDAGAGPAAEDLLLHLVRALEPVPVGARRLGIFGVAEIAHVDADAQQIVRRLRGVHGVARDVVAGGVFAHDLFCREQIEEFGVVPPVHGADLAVEAPATRFAESAEHVARALPVELEALQDPAVAEVAAQQNGVNTT